MFVKANKKDEKEIKDNNSIKQVDLEAFKGDAVTIQ